MKYDPVRSNVSSFPLTGIKSPFFVVEMNSVEDAKTLAQRAILIK